MPPTFLDDIPSVPKVDGELLTPDDRMALTNLWEEGLNMLSEKVRQGLTDSIKDTGFGGDVLSQDKTVLLLNLLVILLLRKNFNFPVFYF